MLDDPHFGTVTRVIGLVELHERDVTEMTLVLPQAHSAEVTLSITEAARLRDALDAWLKA